MKFFRLVDDLEIRERWFLNSVRDAKGASVDPESFRVAKRVAARIPLNIALRQPGHPLDFTFADFDMPVASQRAAAILKRFAAAKIQFFPASVESSSFEFQIVNILEARWCVDESASEFEKWTAEDDRPDKLGSYRQVTRLVLHPDAVAGLHAFRVEGWKIALVVSEQIKSAFEATNISGVKFLRVA